MLCILAICFICGFPALAGLFSFDRMYFIKTSIVSLKSQMNSNKSSAVLFYSSKIRRPCPSAPNTVPFFPSLLIVEIPCINCCFTKVILADSIHFFTYDYALCLKMQTYYKANRKLGTFYFDVSSAFWKTCRT